VLGVGGDNSNNSEGTFFEGVVTNGAPSSATDLLIMKNIRPWGTRSRKSFGLSTGRHDLRLQASARLAAVIGGFVVELARGGFVLSHGL
jgi:hypothetical protein